MGYTVKALSTEEAKKQTDRFPFALLYKISEICLCKSSDLTEADWDECFEARLFGEDGETHLFDQGKKAVLVEDDGTCEYIDRAYEISGAFRKEGKQLIVRQYLGYDEDGQGFVKLTRCAGIR